LRPAPRSTAGTITTLCLSVFVINACFSSSGMCANVEQERLAAPDSLMDLVVFERDCGATTNWSTQVSIVKRGQALRDEPGNLFISEDRAVVRAAWQSASVAEVRYQRATRVVREVRSFEGVTVTFFPDSTVR
jgi:hypothetical protein